MGMESGQIPDGALTASSSRDWTKFGPISSRWDLIDPWIEALFVFVLVKLGNFTNGQKKTIKTRPDISYKKNQTCTLYSNNTVTMGLTVKRMKTRKDTDVKIHPDQNSQFNKSHFEGWSVSADALTSCCNCHTQWHRWPNPKQGFHWQV